MPNRVKWLRTLEGELRAFPSVVSIVAGESSPALTAEEFERATSGGDPLGEAIEADATVTGVPKAKIRGTFSVDKPASPAKE